MPSKFLEMDGVIKVSISGTEEMAQWLGKLTVPTEIPNQVPSTHMREGLNHL